MGKITKLSKFSIFAIGLSEAGRLMIQRMVASYLLFYAINYGGVSAAALGIVIMVAKLWDGINDPMMGVIVDNTSSRWGKARPYILFFTIPAVASLFMMFAIPAGLSATAKIAWIAVAYIALSTFQTAIDIPAYTLLVRTTTDPAERMSISSVRSILGPIGILLPVIIISALTKNSADPGKMITLGTLIVCAITAVSYFTTFLGTKELDIETKNKLSIKDGAKSLYTNSNWIRLALINLIYSLHYAVMLGVQLFYLTSVYKQPNLFLPITFAMIVATVIAGIIAKPFSLKFGKKAMLVTGIMISALSLLLRVVTGEPTVMIFAIGYVIYGFGCVLTTIAVQPMIGECIDYGEKRTGKRAESLSFSGVTFGIKIGTAIATAALAFAIEKAGYVSGSIEQAPEVLKMFFTAGVIFPMVLLLIELAIGLSYNLDAKFKKNEKNYEISA